mmetsp:Transcript_85492/g.275187  ORF Transcript_85492/g.275187 Transcript_85492/m.275187 type:complete len:360 (+) Transcript_85492:95-1174(+)
MSSRWRSMAILSLVGAVATALCKGLAFSVASTIRRHEKMSQGDLVTGRHHVRPIVQDHPLALGALTSVSETVLDIIEGEEMVDEINDIAESTEHYSATAAAAAVVAGAAVVATGSGSAGRRKARQPVLTLKGDTLEQTPAMVMYTVAYTVLTFGVLARSLMLAPAGSVLGIACGCVMAELFSGTFHWATDNYGSLETPFVGFACAAFQGHHLAPWTITFRPFINNVFKIARVGLPLTTSAALLLPPPLAAFAATIFFGQLLAQEFHRWSHTPSSKLAPWQRWLQSIGVAVPCAEHCRHHKPPFAAHYCILSGGLNPLLDSQPVLFWRRLEAFFFRLTKVEPNCWKGERGAEIRECALSL